MMTIQKSDFFTLDELFSFSQRHFSTIEQHQVCHIVIRRPASESKGLVLIETTTGSADEDDFISYSGPVIFNPGEETVYFPIGIKNDNEDEPEEDLYVQIHSRKEMVSSRPKRSPTREPGSGGQMNLDFFPEAKNVKARISISSAMSAKSNYVLRFHRETVEERIQSKWIGPGTVEDKYFVDGIAALKTAVDEKKLLPGMAIWQAVPLTEGPWQHLESPTLVNMLNTAAITLGTGQVRDFQYFHVAVFVGTAEGKNGRKRYYVVENGGADVDNDDMMGKVSLERFGAAFHDGVDHKFFIVAPPKEPGIDGVTLVSAREKVAIRALATLGVPYRYSMNSVNCEAFASIMYNIEKPLWDPIQAKVIKDTNGLTFKDVNKDTMANRKGFFNKFHADLKRSVDLFNTWNNGQEAPLSTSQDALNKYITDIKGKHSSFQWWLQLKTPALAAAPAPAPAPP